MSPEELINEVTSTFLNILNRVVYTYSPWVKINSDIKLAADIYDSKVYMIRYDVQSEKNDIVIRFYWSKNFKNPQSVWGGKPWFQANVFSSHDGLDMLDDQFLFSVRSPDLNELVNLIKQEIDDKDGDSGDDDNPEPTGPEVPSEKLEPSLTAKKKRKE